MDLFRFSPGSVPLLVSVPHAGRHVPDDLASTMTAQALTLPDTDWHVDRLYGFASEIGAAMLIATHSRYVIDLNRPPDDAPLYPGTATTGLCSTNLFDGAPIYREGMAPDARAAARRRSSYWQPYHDKLAAELAAIREIHGIALLWDAHSIRSEVPRLFDGRLPDFNLGTAGGMSADPDLAARVLALAAQSEEHTAVLNGRFTGGYITRNYGNPANGIHAIQLELAQITYMDEEPPYAYREDLAEKVQPVVRRLLDAVIEWA